MRKSMITVLRDRSSSERLDVTTDPVPTCLERHKTVAAKVRFGPSKRNDVCPNGSHRPSDAELASRRSLMADMQEASSATDSTRLQAQSRWD
jgi:hypothetical protein